MSQAHTHEEALSKDFSIKKAIQYGWDAFKKNTGVLVGASVIIVVVSLLLSGLYEATDNFLLATLISFASYVIQAGLALGIMHIALEIYHGRSVDVQSLLDPFDDRIWSYIFASILYGLMVSIGLFLFIIPGIWAALTFAFFPYPILEDSAGAFEALSRSKEITSGAKWHLILFFVVAWLLNMIGFLVLVVGLLVTVPVVTLATVSVYYILKEATDGTTPPAEADEPLPEEADEQVDKQEHGDSDQEHEEHNDDERKEGQEE